ncbi:CHAT domain-containing protein [Fusarium heterosporum]|uniref:CHAT domain-containing protein n=1 Tax=Fusarium heterosporum TaxID=42747 RepID=A0A8H5SJ36_FUSHE|nr:CHAT domain-containing protein [Fusarium heterosporum]
MDREGAAPSVAIETQAVTQGIEAAPDEATLTIEFSKITDQTLEKRLKMLYSLLKARYILKEGAEDLDGAIKAMENAIQLAGLANPDRPAWLMKLSKLLTIRFNQKEEESDLNGAIMGVEEALRLSDRTHQDRPAWLRNIYELLVKRYDLKGDAKDFRIALQASVDTVGMPDGGNQVQTDPQI